MRRLAPWATILLATYTTGGAVRDSLEEKLGKEGADAVENVLEQLLRGGRR